MNRLSALLTFFGLVLCVSSAHADTDAEVWTKATWVHDGIRLSGQYHPARAPKELTWVLLHGLGSVKEEWLPFALKLSQQGAGVFIYDARGHGASVHRADGTEIHYKEFTTAGPGSQWDAMSGDLTSAVAMLHKRFQVPVSKMAVGGASLGANVALVYAAAHLEVPALVLLSPGINYAGIGSEDAFLKYANRPVFMAASPSDGYAYEAIQHLATFRRDAGCLVVPGEGAEHGVDMFKQENFTNQLLKWMKEQ